MNVLTGPSQKVFPRCSIRRELRFVCAALRRFKQQDRDEDLEEEEEEKEGEKNATALASN